MKTTLAWKIIGLMRKALVTGIFVSIAALLLYNQRQTPEPPEQPRPPIHHDTEYKQKIEHPRPAVVGTRTGTLKSVESSQSGAAQTPSPKTEPRPINPEPISIQEARRLAWESMPTTPEAMDAFYEQRELSENHPPPKENESKYFRGLIYLNDKTWKRIDMRFAGDQWVISEDKRGQMTPWPPRDAIPLKDQLDVWSIYYDGGLRLLLRHVPKVTVPELNGDFEVLSGWILNRETISGTIVLIAMENGWPSEELFHDLKPTRW